MSDVRVRTLLWPGVAREQLVAELASLDVIDLDVANDFGDFAEKLDGAEILALPSYHYSGDVARALYQRGRSLRFIQLLTAGYEQVGEAGVPAGVALANASPAMAPAVAEHAVALLLALCRDLPTFVAQQQRRYWERHDFKRLRSLVGARVAIIGFGHIGREIAVRLRPLGAQIVAVTRSGAAAPLADEAISLDRLTEVVASVDAAIVALPYVPANHHLVGAALIESFRPGALLVNIARGGLVDVDAVVPALESGRLGGYATDVTEPEPLPPASRLWNAPNSLITPHVAAADGDAGGRKLACFAAENILRFVRGEKPRSLIVLVPTEKASA